MHAKAVLKKVLPRRRGARRERLVGHSARAAEMPISEIIQPQDCSSRPPPVNVPPSLALRSLTRTELKNVITEKCGAHSELLFGHGARAVQKRAASLMRSQDCSSRTTPACTLCPQVCPCTRSRGPNSKMWFLESAVAAVNCGLDMVQEPQRSPSPRSFACNRSVGEFQLGLEPCVDIN